MQKSIFLHQDWISATEIASTHFEHNVKEEHNLLFSKAKVTKSYLTLKVTSGLNNCLYSLIYLLKMINQIGEN